MTVLRLPCSGCMETVRVNLDAARVTARKPSNGVRGAKHVPAHDVVEEITFHGGLAEWDCPLCGHADSTYEDDDVRAALT